jgi:hypothetical protein
MDGQINMIVENGIELSEKTNLGSTERRLRYGSASGRRIVNMGGFGGFNKLNRRVSGISNRRVQTDRKNTGCKLEGKFYPLIPEPQQNKDLGRKMGFYTFRYHVNSLKGRILTLLDASITNPKQHKALKDLIEAQFYEQLKRCRETMYNGLVEPSTMPNIEEGEGAEETTNDVS